MSSKQEQLERFFDVYAKNYALVRQLPYFEISPIVDDVVICPICLLMFDRMTVFEKILTLEHVPPKSLGGKPRTITCYECNHLFSSLDEKLRQIVADKPFLEGRRGSSITVSARFENGPGFVGKFELIDEVNRTWQITHPQKISDEHNERILQAMAKPNNGISIRFRTSSPHAKNVNLLRIGYLKLFSVFGYGLVFHPNYSNIRKQLQNPTVEVLPNFGLIEAEGARFNDEFLGVNIVHQPSSLISFLIVFDLKPRNGKPYRIAELLPGPGTPNFSEIMSRLDERLDNESFDIRVYHVGSRFHGREFTYPMLTYDIWQQLSGNSEK